MLGAVAALNAKCCKEYIHLAWLGDILEGGKLSRPASYLYVVLVLRRSAKMVVGGQWPLCLLTTEHSGEFGETGLDYPATGSRPVAAATKETYQIWMSLQSSTLCSSSACNVSNTPY